MYPFVGGVAASNGLEAKNPTSGTTFNGGWTHNISGSTGNGTNGYGNLNWNLQTLFPHGTTNSHWGAYCAQGGSSTYIFGGWDSANGNSRPMTLEVYNGGGNDVYRNYNTNSSAIIFSGVPSGNAYVLGTMRSNTDRQAYHNGVSIGTNTTNEGQLAPGLNAYIGAANSGSNPTGPTGYSNHRLQFLNVGSGLTNSEVTTLTNIIQTFQTSLGRNTY